MRRGGFTRDPDDGLVILVKALRFSFVSLVAIGGVLLFAGCAGSAPASNGTVTASPSPSPSASVSPSSSSNPGAGGTTRCITSNLTGSIVENAGGGAAGSNYVNVVLTNNGTAACTLQGWPGVSFVGDNNGTQLGAAANFNRQSPHATVTLAAGGGTATAQLQIVDAQNYSASACNPVTADGFRVYPPGETASLFIPDNQVTACTSSSVKLLTVNALVAG
jgi:hypothetical protein